MTKMIAFCGLDCAECEAYKATQANDEAWKERLVVKWRVEFNHPEMPIEAVNCDGCTVNKRLGGYCAICPIRACAVERAYSTCAECPEMGCEKSQFIFNNVPAARANLETLRK